MVVRMVVVAVVCQLWACPALMKLAIASATSFAARMDPRLAPMQWANSP
jgi:hypothetical protein